MSFDAVSFLYLNPQLNLTSIEDAYNYVTNSNATGLQSNLDPIPATFNDQVFVFDNKNAINISGLNSTIRSAMINEGISVSNVEASGEFQDTIFRPIYNTSNNTFQFILPGDPIVFRINSSNLQVGDYVRLVKNDQDYVTASVTGIIDDNTFTLSNSAFEFADGASSKYTLLGIKLYDIERLARIEYLRLRNTNPTTFIDTKDFNFQLYQTLYPDSRLMDPEVAFTSYKNYAGQRIGTVDDFINFLGSQSNPAISLSNRAVIDELTVNDKLTLNFGSNGGGRLNMSGVDIYYISTDDRSTSLQVSPFFDGLITEKAIKTYIDRDKLVLSTLCNLDVTNIVNIQNTLNAQTANLSNANVKVLNVTSNLSVSAPTTLAGSNILSGPTFFTNTATFCNTVSFLSNLNALGVVTTNSNLNAQGIVNFNSNAIFNSQLTLSSNASAIMNGQSFFNGKTVMCNNFVIDSNATTISYAPFNVNVLNVLGVSTFSNVINANANLNANAAVNINSNIYVNSDIFTYCNQYSSQINASNLYAGTLTSSNQNALNINASNVTVSNIVGSNATFLTSATSNASIVNANLSNATISNASVFTLNAQSNYTSNAFIQSLTASNIFTPSLSYDIAIGQQLNLTSLYNSNSFLSNATVQTGTFSNLNAVQMSVSNASLSNLNANVLNAQQANIQTANVLSNNTSNLYVKSGVADVLNVTSNIVNVERVQNLYGSNVYGSNAYITNLYSLNSYTSNEFVNALSSSNLVFTVGTATNLSVLSNSIQNAQINELSTSNFAALSASLSNMYTSNATISNLRVVNGNTSNFTAVNATLNQATIQTSFLTNVFASNINTSNLTLNNISVSSVTASTVNAVNLTASNITGLTSRLNYTETTSNASMNTATSNLIAISATMSNITVSNARFVSSSNSNLYAAQLLASNSTLGTTNISNLTVTSSILSNAVIISSCNYSSYSSNANIQYLLNINQSNVNFNSVNSYIENLRFSNLIAPSNARFSNITASNIYSCNAYSGSNFSFYISASNGYIKGLKVDTLEIISGANQVFSNVLYMDVDDLLVHDTLTVSSNTYSPAYGITDGGYSNNLPSSTTPSDYTFKNLQVNETLGVNGYTIIGNNSNSVQLTVNGLIQATNLNTTSDVRLKKEITNISTSDALQYIKQLDPVTYRFKNQPDNRFKYGFIAQDVDKVLPNAIFEVDNYDVVIQHKMTPISNDTFKYNDQNIDINDGELILLRSTDFDGVCLTHHMVKNVTKNDHTFTVDPPLFNACNKFAVSLEKVKYKNIKNIDYNQLISLLVGSVKELSNKIDKLTNSNLTNCH